MLPTDLLLRVRSCLSASHTIIHRLSTYFDFYSESVIIDGVSIYGVILWPTVSSSLSMGVLYFSMGLLEEYASGGD